MYNLEPEFTGYSVTYVSLAFSLESLPEVRNSTLMDFILQMSPQISFHLVMLGISMIHIYYAYIKVTT